MLDSVDGQPGTRTHAIPSAISSTPFKLQYCLEISNNGIEMLPASISARMHSRSYLNNRQYVACLPRGMLVQQPQPPAQGWCYIWGISGMVTIPRGIFHVQVRQSKDIPTAGPDQVSLIPIMSCQLRLSVHGPGHMQPTASDVTLKIPLRRVVTDPVESRYVRLAFYRHAIQFHRAFAPQSDQLASQPSLASMSVRLTLVGVLATGETINIAGSEVLLKDMLCSESMVEQYRD